MSDRLPFGGVVADQEQLRARYRAPSALVADKKHRGLDPGSRDFVARSPFVLVATAGDDGVDVSPRGGAPGFVHVLDGDDGASYVAIPDLNGNNLIDTLRAVVSTGRAGTLFVVPGKDETVRVNGAAWVSVDEALLDRFQHEVRRPKAVLVVRADEVFVHCAKAFRRGGVWRPETWAELADAPDLTEIICRSRTDVEPEPFRAALEATYAADLAADAPE